MTKKKLTKKQRAEMLYNATMIAEGAMDETNDMSYIQAWQHLVDTGVVWELQGFFGRAAHQDAFRGHARPRTPYRHTPRQRRRRMKVGDLIEYNDAPHIVLKIRPSEPVARVGLENVVLKNTQTLKTYTIPVKWVRR